MPEILSADHTALYRVLASPVTVDLLIAVRASMLHCLHGALATRPILGTYGAVHDYLQLKIAYAPREQVEAVFLDARNGLLGVETVARGTVDTSVAFPREVVRRALELGASALILAHNHPSGDPHPSRSDIDLTRAVANAATAVDVTLHDHLIFARGEWRSMKQLGLI